MKEVSNNQFESSDLDRFLIVGNPNRYKVTTSAERLKVIIDGNRIVDFVASGPNPTETFQHIYDYIDQTNAKPKTTAIIIIGGDGTIRNVLESLRINDDFREMPSIFTKFVGGARDLNSNLSMRKNNLELADLIDYNLLQKGYIHPIEATFENNQLKQKKIRAYNVLGIGLTALMADQINHHQIFKHRAFQMLVNSLVVSKQVFSNINKFQIITEDGRSSDICELIITKGKRFAGIVKTTSNDLDPNCKLHTIENLDWHFVMQLALGKKLNPSLTISRDQSIKFQIIDQIDQIGVQADGEVFFLNNPPMQVNIGLAQKGSAVLMIKDQS